ncbi:MAG: PIN domain-containing protein [Nanoarchaeota archaeon]
MKFYLDTNIWMDFLADRSEGTRLFGAWTLSFLRRCIMRGDTILLSDVVIAELGHYYPPSTISQEMAPFRKRMEMLWATTFQWETASRLSKERKIPIVDAAHAILAKECKAILVSRDHHFLNVSDIVEIGKPENLL